jgi:hypothetical protein
MLADPVPDLNMVMGVLGKPGSLDLLRGEEALLLLGNFEKPSRRFADNPAIPSVHAPSTMKLRVFSSETPRMSTIKLRDVDSI